MTDDPFLAPPPQPEQPGQPPQANVPAPYVPPAQYSTQAPPQYSPQAPPQYSPQPPAQYPPQPPQYAQPGYAQPGYAQPGYAQPGYPPPPIPYANQSKPKTWMNWVAFGCGLGAFLTCVSFIPAIIFGHLGLAAAKRGEADQKGVGIAGLVIGYVFLVGAIAYVALIVGLAASGDLS